MTLTLHPKRIKNVTVLFSDKKKDARGLKRLREEIGQSMRTSQFEKLCLERLGYATNPWEIEHVRASKEAVGETWVSCTKAPNRRAQHVQTDSFIPDARNCPLPRRGHFGILAV